MSKETSERVQELIRTKEHLPGRVVPQLYKIVSTKRLNVAPTSASETHALPEAVICVNVIQVAMGHEKGPISNFSSLVCSSFDVLPCAIAVTVNDNGKFEYVARRETFDCLHRRRGNRNAHDAGDGQQLWQFEGGVVCAECRRGRWNTG